MVKNRGALRVKKARRKQPTRPLKPAPSKTRRAVLYLQVVPLLAIAVGAVLWAKERFFALPAAPSMKREAKIYDNLGRDRRVMVVPNFLAPALAEEWYRELTAAAAADARGAADAPPSWVYTTNNNGSLSDGGNQKVRGNHAIAARRRVAQALHAKHAFAYSKWELQRAHSVFSAAARHFKKGATRRTIRGLTAALAATSRGGKAKSAALTKVADMFVTRYRAGDFLSPHQDFYSGSVAFVLSLSRGPARSSNETWRAEYGGSLSFQCEEEGVRTKWCNEIEPQFNTLVLFRTRSLDARTNAIIQGPLHAVSRVGEAMDDAGFNRFAITGWFEEKETSKERVRDRAAEIDVEERKARGDVEEL
jgi:hypothetical protein